MYDNVQRIYDPDDFTALTNELNLPYLTTQLEALTLEVMFRDIRATSNGGLLLDWGTSSPTAADKLAIDGLIAAYTGGATTSAPFVAVNAGPITAASGTLVDVLDLETSALDEGTYQVIMSCTMRMQAVVVGDAARATLTLTPGPAAPRTQREHWGEAVAHAYNFAATFERQAGQTIRVQLQISEVGPGAGVAEITDARVTIDKIS